MHAFLVPQAVAYVQAPMFIWQSKFDHFQLTAFEGLECSAEQVRSPAFFLSLTLLLIPARLLSPLELQSAVGGQRHLLLTRLGSHC
jgi:hypothetical protein